MCARFATSLGALGATIALLSACGTGTAAQTTGASVPSAGSARDHLAVVSSPSEPAAQRAPSRAQALTFARAVNLSARDLPGASIAPRTPTTSDARERREYRACERSVEREHQLVEASSPRLRRGQELETEEISSGVTVLSDEHAAVRQLSALGMPSLRECIARALTRNFADKAVREARWGRFTITRLAVHAPGASATIGLRIASTLNFPFSEVSVPVYVDLLGFAAGPAEVGLSAASVTQPVPTSTEQELVALLLARARAHPL